MGTSHGLPPPDTSHSEQRRINCLLTWTQDPSWTKRQREGAKPKATVTRLFKAGPSRQNYTAKANSRSSSWLWLLIVSIIENLIKSVEKQYFISSSQQADLYYFFMMMLYVNLTDFNFFVTASTSSSMPWCPTSFPTSLWSRSTPR